MGSLTASVSQLRSLSIEGHETQNVLKALEGLPTTQLVNLQVLKLEIVNAGNKEINQRIVGNLKGRLENLEILKLGLPAYYTIDTSALFKHGGGRLRRVDLLSSRPSVPKMKEICRYCPQLVDMQLWLNHYKSPMVSVSRLIGSECLRFALLT